MIYMLEILQFTFQNFWHFAGVLILLSVIVDGIGAFITLIKK